MSKPWKTPQQILHHSKAQESVMIWKTNIDAMKAIIITISFILTDLKESTSQCKYI